MHRRGARPAAAPAVDHAKLVLRRPVQVPALWLRILVLVAVSGLPPAAPARGNSGPGLATLALDWARGHYATPLVCEIGGRPVRGTRRVLVTPAGRGPGPAVDRIVFVDLDPGEARRCFDDFGNPEPNIVGTLEIQHLASYHPETAQRDFREELRRNRGFQFEITGGRLRVQEIGKPAPPSEDVDFERGRATLRSVEPGSDAQRLLAEFESPRKLMLELESRDGRRFSFPLFLRALR